MKSLSTTLAVSLLLAGCGEKQTEVVNDSNKTASKSIDTKPVAKPKANSLLPDIGLEGSELQPFAYVKIIALPKLLQKAMTVAQAVKPDPQVAMLPMMAGMALGDPSLASIDADAPIGLFVFDEFGGDDVTFTLAMKLTEESPIRKQAETLKLALIERDGWTLATKAPELFDQVKDWSPMLDFVEQAPEGDLEVGVRLSPLWDEMPKLEGAIEGGLLASPFEDDTKESLKKLSGVMLEEIATLDSAKINLFLSSEEVAVKSTMRAKDGSALSQQFQSKAKTGNSQVANFVPSGGFFDVVMDYDTSTFPAYVNHLVEKIAPIFEGEFKQILLRYQAMAADLPDFFGGQAAARYDVGFESSNMDFVQVGTTKVSPEEFGKMFEEYLKLNQELFDKIDFFQEMGIKYEFDLNQTKPVEGIPTFRISMKMDMQEVDEAIFPAGLPYSNMSYLYAVMDGHYAMAMDEKQLGELIKRIREGKEIEDSLAENLPIQSGQSLRWSMDMVKYASLILGASEISLTSPAIEEKLSKMELAPVTGSMSVGDGRVSADVRIPLKTIKAGVDYFENEVDRLEEIPQEAAPNLPEIEEETEQEN